ncbi:MAG: HAMP domain-containing histidine kinase [bacterium]|nr:HAMP domain-containing histidine kinase [bacterium]
MAAIAVVDRYDFYADHDRLTNRVMIAAAFLVGAAAWAGFWLAGRGTRATGAALAQQERLLSDAAHELRTPVAKIRAVAESGMAGDEPPSDALGRVARLGEDAGQMVDDMLFLARLDADREELHKEPLRLDLLVEEVASKLDGVTIEAVETVVDGDAGLLRRAVSNLLRNAASHGGGEIKATVYPSRVIVGDRGPGIDPTVAGHLFERFHTGPSSNGHGLGLPIVKWIVEAHGGSIAVTARDGGGTEATLTLPG